MEISHTLNPTPKHIAIIMDGNGRWANKRHLPRIEGHKKGALSAQNVIELFIEYKIPYLTLFAFSTENWNRPQDEVNGLFELMEAQIEQSISYAIEKKVRFIHLGKTDRLSAGLREQIKQATAQTKDYNALTLCVAFNYGGRDEIVQATRRMIAEGLRPDEIDEHTMEHYLYTTHIPDPDLLIRTGGEKRVSNFLLWQSAYTEIYFTPVLWPDFGRKDIDRALNDYSRRQRRFGNV